MARPATEPTGIDSGHAYASAITHAWLAYATTGGGADVPDLVGSADATLAGATRSDTNGLVCTAATGATLTEISIGTPYSIMWRSAQTANDAAGMIAGRTSDNSWFIWTGNGGSVGVAINPNINNFVGGSGITTLTDYCVTLSGSTGTDTLRLFTKTAASSTWAEIGSGLTISGAAFPIAGLGRAFGTNTFWLVGNLEFLQTFNTALTATNLNASFGDPYSIYSTSGPALASGTASTSSSGNTIATVTCGAASGGTSPYTYQWYRDTSSGFTPSGANDVPGATSLTLNDTGLTNGTTYYYVCRVTDDVAATDDSNEVSATPVSLNDFAVNDASIFFSPYNWRLSGSSFAQVNTSGAYLKTKFSGASCTLLLDTSSLSALSSGEYPVLVWSVNGGAFQRSQLTSGQTTLSLATGLGSGPHTLEIYVAVAAYDNDRWTTEFVKITGIRLATSATLSAPTLYSGRMLVYADSNGEGWESLGAGTISNQDATVAFPLLIARAFECEVGVVAYAGQGYITSALGVPSLGDAWDFYSDSQSRLSAGLFSPEPDWIVSTHGQNDGSGPYAAVVSLIGDWRTAAPSAKIAICSPSNLNHASNIAGAVTDAADANAKWITTGEAIFIPGGGYVNNGHLTGLRGHPRYAAALIGQIKDEFATGGGGSGLAASIISGSGGLIIR